MPIDAFLASAFAEDFGDFWNGVLASAGAEADDRTTSVAESGHGFLDFLSSPSAGSSGVRPAPLRSAFVAAASPQGADAAGDVSANAGLVAGGAQAAGDVSANAGLVAGGAQAPTLNREARSQQQQLEDLWQNLEGLPRVSVLNPSDAYFSKDLADLPQESRSSPTFGCKCDNWQPALTHPQLDFRRDFLVAHPDFLPRVRSLKVHMEDLSMPRVHWDAEYDIKHFLEPGETPRLAENTPALPGSGEQPRFMTFCPRTGGPPHNYELSVTALDRQGLPIEYFDGKTSLYVAEPPAPASGAQPEELEAEQAVAAQLSAAGRTTWEL